MGLLGQCLGTAWRRARDLRGHRVPGPGQSRGSGRLVLPWRGGAPPNRQTGSDAMPGPDDLIHSWWQRVLAGEGTVDGWGSSAPATQGAGRLAFAGYLANWLLWT